MDNDIEDYSGKIAQFQSFTGLEDVDLCTEILLAHEWNLEQAITTFTSSSTSATNPGNDVGSSGQSNFDSWEGVDQQSALQIPTPAPHGLAWKLITLPFSVISGSLGLISGAFGLGIWVASGILSRSLGMLGLGHRAGVDSSDPLVSLSTATIEALEFVDSFERDFGEAGPSFAREGFMDALQRSRQMFKLLFVYLHSPDHPDTLSFCENTLCAEPIAAYINENFVSWGGNIRASEGFKMSNSLKASTFPFCAVVMAATNQRIALLQQIEGPTTPEQMLTILHQVVDESAPVLVTARLDAEERRNSARLREEQDAAYRAALEADRARELKMKEDQERLEREAAEAEKKRKEEEEALERNARESAEKEAAIARKRQEKAMSLGPEPEKGPDVTQVLVRFPSGERRERRFYSSATIKNLYDYVDSLDCLKIESYSLVSNFPRVVYGQEKRSLSLKEAGLHPQASVFVEVDS